MLWFMPRRLQPLRFNDIFQSNYAKDWFGSDVALVQHPLLGECSYFWTKELRINSSREENRCFTKREKTTESTRRLTRQAWSTFCQHHSNESIFEWMSSNQSSHKIMKQLIKILFSNFSKKKSTDWKAVVRYPVNGRAQSRQDRGESTDYCQ